MIRRIIEFSIRNKLVVGIFTLALIGWGIWSMTRLPVDAVPDITNNQVQVISIASALATQEVEKFITAPIEVSVSTLPDVIELRSISRLGLSVVTIVFKDKVDIYKARQQISERLKEAEEQIPDGLTHPELAPVSTGLGEIYQYLVKVRKGYEGKYSMMDLRTIQDWIIKRELLGTPGVAEVNSYGGYVKEYEVAIDPERLNSMGISVPEILDALEKNNENTGSAYIEKGPNSYFIRGIGLISTLEDIGKIVVRISPGQVPVLIRDVGEVRFGHAIRYGAFVCDTSEAVGGVVMMLKGSNASRVITDVKERMKTISASLPPGICIEPYLDRTDLVERAIGTVTRNLAEGGLIVIFVLVLMLGSFRAGFIVASVIPLSMLFAISMMNLFGISGNLMSLGAIDFGLIVDGAVIIVESAVHRLSIVNSQSQPGGKLLRRQIDEVVLDSSRRMMSSATFGQIIILIVYLPILSLVGIEGKMFRPMAQTVGFAIVGALILSLTYVPVISSLVLSRRGAKEFAVSGIIMRFFNRIFEPMFRFSFHHKATVMITSFVLLLAGIFLFTRLGGEFIPTLEEGDLASGIMTLQGGSLAHTVETVKKANKILKDNFPEVRYAVCKVGAGEIPTDPTPVETGDYIIAMKDKKEWTTASTREEMVEKMKEKVGAVPGVAFTFQQPISMRFNELMTGSKQDVAIKIFGDDLDSLAHEASRVEKLISGVEGVTDIQVEQVTGASQITVLFNREKIAQYGLNIEDANRILRTAFAGNKAGVIYEGEKRFDLVVRFKEDYRQDIDNVRRLYIPLPNGRQIPLEELATVEMKNGTAQVSREDARRRITVGFNIRNRDVQSVITDIRKIIDRGLMLPPGYYITYGGQFENLVAAQKRLSIALPVALLLILFLLYFTFHSIKETLLISTALPLAAIGGVIALTVRGMNFSISAGVGFIALFGVAVLNGIVLISEFNRLEREEGMANIYERVMTGLKIRLRPVLMTAAVASLGFLPMAMSTSAGAEVQKPLATVVIGGLISSTLLTLLVLPVLYIIFMGERKPRSGNLKPKPIPVILLVLAGLLFAPMKLAAQSPVRVCTLELAIGQALQRNGEIRTSLLEIESQKALRQTAWDFNKTEVDFSYGQKNSFEKDDEFSISQRFSFPLTYIDQSKLARAMVENATLKSAMTNNEIISQVRSVYYQLVFFYTRLDLLRSQDSIYSNFLNAAQLRFQKGETNLLEKMTAEAQLLTIRNQIKQAASDIRIGKCRLQTLINERNEIQIADTVLVKLPMVLSLDSTAIFQNPSLKFLEYQMTQAKIERQTETSRLFPDMMIGYFNQSNKEFSPDYRFTGIQAGLTIPVLFFPQKGKIESAKLEEKKAMESYKYQTNAFQHQLHILVEENEKYRQSLAYFESVALQMAEAILEQADKSYKAGAIDYMEFVQNLRQGIEIRNNYLETLNAYNQSVIAIEFLLNINH
ncbi:MAG: CusA/CzcA family heavy metal efflux RND transporter [Bacteroidales bacterium]|nr:CusA/CzcA family heavy metal efflux RND transporter [Bacteroidales bacterium]